MLEEIEIKSLMIRYDIVWCAMHHAIQFFKNLLLQNTTTSKILKHMKNFKNQDTYRHLIKSLNKLVKMRSLRFNVDIS